MKLLAVLLICSQAFAADVVRLDYTRHEGKMLITGRGTAFCVRDSHTLLTAAHVVLGDDGKPYDTIRIELRGEWIPAKVTKIELKYDIALLEIAAEMTPLVLGEDLKVGDEATLCGSPRGMPVTLFKAKMKERHWQGTIRDAFTVTFDHGDSGGCVISDGKVRAIAVCGIPKNGDIDHSVGLVIPASVIVAEFLK